MRTETFATPGHVTLDIKLGAGEIRVETGSATETIVELEPLRDDDATREAVESARVEARDRGDGHEVTVDVSKSGRRFGRGPQVRISISAPEGADLECRSGSADIEGRGRFGEIDIESGSGDIQLQEIGGNAKVNAASGDIRIATVGGDARLNSASGDIQVRAITGGAKVNSASGDIQLREVGGELQANSASGDVHVSEVGGGGSVNTASGDVEIGAVKQGSFSFKSASGDLRVGIRAGSRLHVDARSRSGEVSSELDVTGEETDEAGPLVELRATTMSGDIHVLRA